MLGLGVAILTVSMHTSVAPERAPLAQPIMPSFKHFAAEEVYTPIALAPEAVGRFQPVASSATRIFLSFGSHVSAAFLAPLVPQAEPARTRTVAASGMDCIPGPSPEWSNINASAPYSHRAKGFGAPDDAGSPRVAGQGPGSWASSPPLPRPNQAACFSSCNRMLPQESVALLVSFKNLAHGPRQTRNRQAPLSHAQDGCGSQRQRSLPQA